MAAVASAATALLGEMLLHKRPLDGGPGSGSSGSSGSSSGGGGGGGGSFEHPSLPGVSVSATARAIIGGGAAAGPVDPAFVPDVVGLYFSAHWCPPCRAFTPELVKAYGEVNGSGGQHQRRNRFEVIFVSNDKSPAEFADYYGGLGERCECCLCTSSVLLTVCC